MVEAGVCALGTSGLLFYGDLEFICEYFDNGSYIDWYASTYDNWV